MKFLLYSQLARRGMNVVLISKSYDSLVQLVARIRESHHRYYRRVTRLRVYGLTKWVAMWGVNSFRITVIIVVYIVSLVH